jgi:hypothetical protein
MDMQLSAKTRALLDDLTQRFARAGFRDGWFFDKGLDDDEHNELAAHHLIQRMGTKGGAWRLTDSGKRWVMAHQEPDEIHWARIVFSTFQKTYRDRLGEGGQWWLIGFEEQDALEIGLTLQQTKTGLQILVQKGLVSTDGSGEGHLELTERGKHACLHQATLDGALSASQNAPSFVDARTSNVFNGPAQVGDGNVQSVTYSVVLQRLVQQIESDPTIPADTKSRWTDTLKDIVASGVGNLVVKGIETILG